MHRTSTAFAVIFSALALGLSWEPASAQIYTQSTLYDFCSQTDCGDGSGAYGNLIQAGDGNFYGITNGPANGEIYRIGPSGEFTIVHIFQGGPSDGAGPFAGLVEGSDGNLYGMTYAGGASAAGTIFKMTSSGTVTLLHSFNGGQSDGQFPTQNSLLQGSDGNFYGTTPFGGASSNGSLPSGYGIVFRLTLSGSFSVLYSFTDGAADGGYPGYALVQGADGNYYGTTYGGGANGSGTIFRISPSGELTTLYSFCSQANCVDGADALNLVLAGDGNFYGTTGSGGNVNPNCAGGCGTVFRITPAGKLSTLYSFCSDTNCEDGAQPADFLVQGSDGNLYGSTANGGYSDASFGGTIFSITPNGRLTTLYAFCATTNCPDGADPSDGVIQSADGNFYGITHFGGNLQQQYPPGWGNVFKLAVSPQLSAADTAPVQVQLSNGSISTGESVTLNWKVLDAFSTTLKQCYAIVPYNEANAGAWSGLQIGIMSNGVYAGSATIQPIASGVYSYALTCGGLQSGYATLNVGAAKVSTAVSLITNSPILAGNYVSMDATVLPEPSVAVPTGSFEFSYGSTSLGSVALVKGAASLNVESTGISSGSYAITATYSGDSIYQASAATETLVITPNPTQTSLNVSPTEVVQGIALTLSSTVIRNSGSGSPTGTVAFYTGSRLLGSAPLKNGAAALTFDTNRGVPPGIYALTAKYSGDSTDQTSTSSIVSVTVLSEAAATVTTLSVIPTSVTQGQSVTLSSSVTRSDMDRTPTGSVTFFANSTEVATASLNNGVGTATLIVPNSISGGIYRVIAQYSGDSADQPSTSLPASVPLIAFTTTTLAVSPNPVPANSILTMTVHVKETFSAGVPVGNVTFSVGGYTAGTAALDATGTATLNLSDIGVATGIYPVTANYPGDSVNTSSAATTDVTVN